MSNKFKKIVQENQKRSQDRIIHLEQPIKPSTKHTPSSLFKTANRTLQFPILSNLNPECVAKLNLLISIKDGNEKVYFLCLYLIQRNYIIYDICSNKGLSFKDMRNY